MENLVKWLEKTHQHNWILFCVVLGLVNFSAFYLIHDKFGVFALKKGDVEYSAFFLGLEILLTSLAITRILVAVDIIYYLQIWPITGDLIVLVDSQKKYYTSLLNAKQKEAVKTCIDATRNTIASKQTTERRKLHAYNNIGNKLATISDSLPETNVTLGSARDVILTMHRVNMLLYWDQKLEVWKLQPYITRYYDKITNPQRDKLCYGIFYTIIALGILTFITIKWLIPVANYFYKIICS